MTAALILRGLSLCATLHSGQAFRWEALGGKRYAGVVAGRCALVCQEGADVALSCDPGDEGFWGDYFAEGRDWAGFEARYRGDGLVGTAVRASAGLRVLRQPVWEAVVAFILSQNNNDGNIRGCLARLCRTAGEAYFAFGAVLYDIPSPQAVFALGEETLRALGIGYRAPYLMDAARHARDEEWLAALARLSYPEARAALTAVKGIGPKVADCIALFALGHTRAFPVDVWIERTAGPLFPGTPKRLLAEAAAARWGDDAGLVQQAIFYHARIARAGGRL